MRKLAALLFTPLFLCAAPPDDSVQAAARAITSEGLLAHIRTLASDEFGGRAPDTEGERKTVDYLIEQAKKLGLKPGNPNGTYIQQVPLWSIRSSGSLKLSVQSREIELAPGQDFFLTSNLPKPEIEIAKAPLVFVGYGVDAPEYKWNDYKHVDVEGKIVVLLSGDPPVTDPSDPSKLDEKMFLGKALSYYGRPSSKYDVAFKHGALACITVYTPRAGANLSRMAQNMPREVMIINDASAAKHVGAQVFLTAEKTSELLTAAGQDLSALRTAAAKPDFQPVPLSAFASLEIKNDLRAINSPNVIAQIPGSDPKLRNEYVICSGHWDHVGTQGDRIYHGASDNAAGTAGVLELARAFTQLHPAPRRTVLFLWPTAEEKGLLGARYYVLHPLYPLSKTVADINLDYFSNWGWGRTRDISIIGIGNSSLDDLVKAAAEKQGRIVTGDTDPEEGFFFRSDHLEFEMAGVPSLETSPGIEHMGKPPGFGVQKRDEYIRNDYHKPSDQIKPDWNLRGSVEDLQILFEVGYEVAQGDARPVWMQRAPYLRLE